MLGSAQISAAAHTTDLAVSSDGRFLFALDGGIGTINVFRIGADGHLAALPDMSPSTLVTPAVTGLVVH